MESIILYKEYVIFIIGLIIGIILTIGICLFLVNKRKHKKIYYPSGILKQDYFLKKGSKNGTEVKYYESGQKSKELFWSDGLLDGEVIEYDMSGNIIAKSTYIQDKCQSYRIYEYYENGRIKSEISYTGNSGTEKIYYQSGELNKEKILRNGVAEGKTTTYYKSGKVYIIDFYKNGALNKKSEVFDENGNIINY